MDKFVTFGRLFCDIGVKRFGLIGLSLLILNDLIRISQGFVNSMRYLAIILVVAATTIFDDEGVR